MKYSDCQRPSGGATRVVSAVGVDTDTDLATRIDPNVQTELAQLAAIDPTDAAG